MAHRLHLGDCLAVLKELEADSVDAVVTDPPYGLRFMGKKWDCDVPSVQLWAECLRVLKPGGHLLAFAGTRTQHRMAVRIEDAGFEIRDMIAWVYGSGFPKSHNGDWGGTALKPALEPITMARKPLGGTVAANWTQHGTGGLNIEACRVAFDGEKPKGSGARESWRTMEGRADSQHHIGNITPEEGRWPANLIHDGSEEVVALFPESKSGGYPPDGGQRSQVAAYGKPTARGERKFTSSEGSAARFFYCAKASRKDRNEGLTSSGVPAVKAEATMRECETADWSRRNGNHHPTVKPIELMRYLCRLVTPPHGVVLDPFMGSGSTGKAAMLESFSFIGIERDKAYFEIADARVKHAAKVTEWAASEPNGATP